jgi:glycerophosphoryl diester phosphodiesterase
MGPYEFGRTLILGHRGAAAHAPDNTLEGFRLALDHGADGVELDVRRSADDVLVLHHEPETPELGLLRSRRFAEIRSIDPSIPTLDEAWDVLSNAVVNIEIKNVPSEGDYDPENEAAVQVADWVKHRAAYPSVIVSSFNPAAVAAVRAANPDIATALLSYAAAPLEILEFAAAAGHQAIHPDHAALEAAGASAVVVAAQSRGLQVATWTVNAPGAAEAFATAGLAAIVTDDPRLIRKTIG